MPSGYLNGPEEPEAQAEDSRSESECRAGLVCPFCTAHGDDVDTFVVGRKAFVECLVCRARGPVCEDVSLGIQRQAEEAQRLFVTRAN